MPVKYNIRTVSLLLAICLVLGVLGSPVAHADNNPETITAAYLYKLVEKIQWPRQERLSSYHFHIIDSNKEIFRAIQSVARLKQLSNKPITSSHSSSGEIPEKTNIIYISQEKSELFPDLFSKLEGRPILIISEEIKDQRLVMINLFNTANNTQRFEINKANIINQNLGIHPDIILLGGTEIDVAQLYKEGQQVLSQQSKKLLQLQKDVVSFKNEKEGMERVLEKEKSEAKKWTEQAAQAKNELKKKHEEVRQLQETTKNQNQKLTDQTDQIDKQQLKITRQELIVGELQDLISIQQQKYNDLQKQITLQEKSLRERESKLDQQKIEIDKRSAVLEKQADDIRRQDIVINEQEIVLKETGSALASERQKFFLVSTVALLILLLAVLLLVSNRNKKQSNKLLNEQKLKLEETAIALVKAKEEADSANNAKTTFLASMSHELRTPLNSILGFTQILLKQYDFSEEQNRHLTTITSSGEHLLELINNVLDISKIEAGYIQLHHTNFNVHLFLEDIIAMFNHRIVNSFPVLLLEIDNTLPKYIDTDEGKLRQIIINLMGNAIKFTPQGNITLQASMNRDNGTLVIEVKDTGIGITEDKQEKIFDAFTQSGQTVHDSEGTGLGLTISRKFAHLLDGDISVVSHPGKGSKFTLNIKVQIPQNLTLQDEKLHKQIIGLVPTMEPPHVLVIDDIPTNREVLIKQLQFIGFVPSGASGGMEALKMLESWQPDLILLDRVMPGIDGIEVAKRIKANPDLKHIPIIFVSASTMDNERREAFAAGADGFISKPINYPELFNVIQEYLDIEYQYAEDLNLEHRHTPTRLKGEDLEGLSEEWLEQFTKAVRLGDTHEMLSMVKTLPDKQTKIKEKITDCIHDFEYKALIKILDNRIKNTNVA